MSCEDRFEMTSKKARITKDQMKGIERHHQFFGSSILRQKFPKCWNGWGRFGNKAVTKKGEDPVLRPATSTLFHVVGAGFQWFKIHSGYLPVTLKKLNDTLHAFPLELFPCSMTRWRLWPWVGFLPTGASWPSLLVPRWNFGEVLVDLGGKIIQIILDKSSMITANWT